MSKSFRSLVGRAALIFAILFTAVGVGQYRFLRWQLNKETESDLLQKAEYMRNSIAYAETWDLQGYRRTTDLPGIYTLMAQNGTLIDTFGYLRGMISHVSLPFNYEFDHPLRFSSDVGEDWDLYVHQLRDGILVLGDRKRVSTQGINGLFASNAAHFGASVEEARHTPERAIDEAFDYAIIDNNGVLIYAVGGIPLKVSSPALPTTPTMTLIRQIDDNLYATYFDPVMSKSGVVVGLISVLDDVTDDEHVLRRSAVFNGVVAAVLWVITVIFSASYLRRARPGAISCSQVPFLDEGETVEFKSSLRWDYKLLKPNKELERAIVKTIVGFMNSENGGTLIIGISDSKEVLGLQSDYDSFKSGKPNRDGFELKLREMLIAAVGERRCARWVKTRFCSLQGKEVCVVTVAPSVDPVFLDDEAGGQLYVRVGNSTRPFGVQEALAYARDRWGGAALPRSHTRRPTARLAG